MKKSKLKKKNHMDKKWASLEKRGLTRPESSEENLRRIREAHGN